MKFTQEDRQRVQNYYVKHLQRHGPYSAQALSWTDDQSQLIRFQALIGVGDLEGKSILDVGCGLGDLYQFLKLNFDDFSYLGIDLVPELIEQAKKKYPSAQFQNWDIMDFPEKSFSYVLSSGAMSFKVPDHKEKYFQMIKKLFNLAQEGVAFNMLDRKGHVDDELFAAYDDKEIVSFCQTLAPNVRLINGYSPQDFTVYLYR
jgi:trans-aconitate methyltransferase